MASYFKFAGFLDGLAAPPSPAYNKTAGAGWVFYETPAVYPAGGAQKYASVGYTRFDWSDIEPVEGNYNWTYIDNFIAAWQAIGVPAALGVMPCNTSRAAGGAPGWVYDAGVSYQTYTDANGTYKMPDWTSVIFKQKTANFVTALAARYDGNPAIAWVDARAFGNWGEGHESPFVADVNAVPAQHMVDLNSNYLAFKKTQVVVSFLDIRQDYIDAHLQWNPLYGWGYRRDNWSRPESWNHPEVVVAAYPTAPAVYELYAGYSWLKANNAWNVQTLLDQINAGKTNYIGMVYGSEYQALLNENPGIIEMLGNAARQWKR